MKISYKPIKAMALGVLLLLSTLNYVSGQSQAEEFPKDKTLKVGRLANGFTYYLKNLKGAEINVRFIVKAGFNQEEIHQNQLAHLIEHMPFQRTKNFVNALGHFKTQKGLMSFNASTSNDLTRYHVNVPVGNHNLLSEVLQFYHDLTDNIDMSKQNMLMAQKSVINEGLLGNNSDDDPPLIKQMLLGDNKFKNKALLGWNSAVKFLDSGAVHDYYKKWYRPNLQALIIVGDVDILQIENEIQRRFSDLKPSKSLYEDIQTVDLIKLNWKDTIIVQRAGPHHGKGFSLHIRQPHRFVRQVSDWKRKAMIEIIKDVIFNRFNLNRVITKSTSIIYTEDAGYLGPMFDTFTFIHPNPDTESTKALEQLLTDRERLVRYGLSDYEVNNSRINILDVLNRAPSASDLAFKYANHFVYGEAVIDASLHKSLLEGIIKSITTDEVNGVLRDMLKMENNTAFIEIKETIPVTVNLGIDKMHSLKKSIEKQKVEPFESKLYDQAGVLNKDLLLYNTEELNSLNRKSIKTIFKEAKDSISGVTTISFDNGIKIFFKSIPYDGKAEKMQLMSVSDKRLEAESDIEFHLASIASEYVFQTGLLPITRFQLDGLNKVSGIDYLRPYSNEIDGTMGFVGGFKKSACDKALQLIRRYLTINEKLDSAKFREFLSARDIKVNSPQSNLHDTIRFCEGKFPMTRFLPDRDKLNKISFKDVERTYRNRFMAIGRYVIVANFELTDSIRYVFAKYLGTLSKTSPAKDIGKNRTRDKERECSGRPIEVILADKTIKNSEVNLTMKGRINQSMKNKLAIELLSEWLNQKIFERLRNKEGGVYDVLTNFDLRKSGEFYLRVNFHCEPMNVKRLTNSVGDEISTISNVLIDDKFLENMKSAKISRHKQNLTSKGFWMGYLISNISSPDLFKSFTDFEAIVNEISPEDIIQLAKSINIAEMNKYILNPVNSR